MRIVGVLIAGVLIMVLSGTAFGQSTREVTTPKPPAPQYQASKKSSKGFFLFNLFKKKNKPVTTQEEVADFRKRMKKTARKNAKVEKKMQDPQYSNPLYFGHKKPPKRRPPGKKKFCKECGLVH
ncbi:hypothetical protein [Marinoscillum furvescens]|uniref:Uncharacterized protein n=1 Tax=Marinoscillum furvescens DSM 4134 TaxID=1122208 RepID=A0A3D9L5F6_MARFU|nr:hypothetical protein [Marinoscillum furvescens]REE01232.1 hypothetical protein C7460_104252 [Marinoscillum furvescens DSM 4134]